MNFIHEYILIAGRRRGKTAAGRPAGFTLPLSAAKSSRHDMRVSGEDFVAREGVLNDRLEDGASPARPREPDGASAAVPPIFDLMGDDVEPDRVE